MNHRFVRFQSRKTHHVANHNQVDPLITFNTAKFEKERCTRKARRSLVLLLLIKRFTHFNQMMLVHKFMNGWKKNAIHPKYKPHAQIYNSKPRLSLFLAAFRRNCLLCCLLIYTSCAKVADTSTKLPECFSCHTANYTHHFLPNKAPESVAFYCFPKQDTFMNTNTTALTVNVSE